MPCEGCAAALASRIGEAAAQGFVAWLWAGADGALPEMSRTAAAEASYASAARREGGREGEGERERRRERRPQREERQRKSVFSRLGAVNKPPSRARDRGSVHSRLGGVLFTSVLDGRLDVWFGVCRRILPFGSVLGGVCRFRTNYTFYYATCR